MILPYRLKCPAQISLLGYSFIKTISCPPLTVFELLECPTLQLPLLGYILQKDAISFDEMIASFSLSDAASWAQYKKPYAMISLIITHPPWIMLEQSLSLPAGHKTEQCSL